MPSATSTAEIRSRPVLGSVEPDAPVLARLEPPVEFAVVGPEPPPPPVEPPELPPPPPDPPPPEPPEPPPPEPPDPGDEELETTTTVPCMKGWIVQM
jgi:hypothetical protein